MLDNPSQPVRYIEDRSCRSPYSTLTAFLVVILDTYRHSQRAEAFVRHVKTLLLYPRSRFPKHAHYWFISGINLNWTCHAFDKPKVIIMGNGYGVRV